MSELPEYIKKTLEDLRRDFAIKVSEARRIVETINTLEQMWSLPQTKMEDLDLKVLSALRTNKNAASQS